RDIILKNKVSARVTAYVTEFNKTAGNNTAQFSSVLSQAAVELGCNTTCVTSCEANITDLTNKTSCLDICLCYYDSALRLPNTTNVTNATASNITANATANVTANATAATNSTIANITLNNTAV